MFRKLLNSVYEDQQLLMCKVCIWIYYTCSLTIGCVMNLLGMCFRKLTTAIPILFAFFFTRWPFLCLVTFLMFFITCLCSFYFVCGLDIVLFQIYIQQWSSAAVAIK